MTPADLIAQARALLAAATPGPWDALVPPVVWHGARVIGNGRTVAVCDTRDGDQDERDATLIASAPTWLAALANALEAAMAENASDRAIQGEAEHRALERAEAAEARVKELEQAQIDWYASLPEQIRRADEVAVFNIARAEQAEREVERLRTSQGFWRSEHERIVRDLQAQLDAARAALRGLEQLFSYSDGMQCYVVPGNERTMPALRAARAALNPAQPTTAAVCGKRCASGSECLRLPHDDDRHETQHGCIFFDPAQPTTEEPTP